MLIGKKFTGQIFLRLVHICIEVVLYLSVGAFYLVKINKAVFLTFSCMNFLYSYWLSDVMCSLLMCIPIWFKSSSTSLHQSPGLGLLYWHMYICYVISSSERCRIVCRYNRRLVEIMYGINRAAVYRYICSNGVFACAFTNPLSKY